MFLLQDRNAGDEQEQAVEVGDGRQLRVPDFVVQRFGRGERHDRRTQYSREAFELRLSLLLVALRVLSLGLQRSHLLGRSISIVTLELP